MPPAFVGASYVVFVAPAISVNTPPEVVLLCHWYVSPSTPPVAVTLNAVVVPTHSKTLIGCVVIAGASVTVTDTSTLITSGQPEPGSLRITRYDLLPAVLVGAS